MTFDARSKERLEALGRTLPKKLPLPNAQRSGSPGAPPPSAATSGAQPAATGAKAVRSQGASPDSSRHAVEREEDPIALFRALMAASPDGTVPPHHLERLRELEAVRQRVSPGPSAGTPLASPSTPAKAAARRSTAKPTKGRSGNRRPGQSQGDESDLYTAFTQLLLEEDGLDD